MGEWISVKDRMPIEGDGTNKTDVLVFIPEREGCKQNGIFIGQLRRIHGDPKGEHNFWGRPTSGSEWTVWSWGYFEEPVVTHWMPLPEPPEADNE